MKPDQSRDPREHQAQSDNVDRSVDGIDVDGREISQPKPGKNRRPVVAIIGVLILIGICYAVVLSLPKDKEAVPRSTGGERLPRIEEVKSLPTGTPRSGSQAVVDPKIPELKDPPSPAPPALPASAKPPITLVPNLPGGSGRDGFGPGIGGMKSEPPPDPYARARSGQLLARNAIADEKKIERAGGDAQTEAVIMPNPNQGGLESRMKPATTEGVGAKRIANPSLTITKGTTAGVITLDTAVSTEQPGMVVGTLTRDVYSTDGKVVLLNKGSRCTAEYQNGLEIGEERIFLLWTRCEDKLTHVVIDLASPGTDELGRAGLGGNINFKWWQRFGTAILFSIISDLPIRKDNQNGGTTVNAFPNTVNAAKDSIQSVLEIYKNVRPSLTQHQGGTVSIIVARDLDFSPVYRVRKIKEGERQ